MWIPVLETWVRFSPTMTSPNVELITFLNKVTALSSDKNCEHEKKIFNTVYHDLLITK